MARTTTTDAAFAKARNIKAVTLRQAKRVMHRSTLVQRVTNKRSTVINLEGEAGIGKTHTIYQIATELAAEMEQPVDVINWKLMSREKEDVGGYPSPSEVRTDVVDAEGNVTHGSVVKCFEYVPEKLLAEVEHKGNPAILFFDEWPRADKSVCSVMFSAIEDGQLGSFQIPMNWFIMAASNPKDGYQGNGVDSDHAYRRRFCWLAVTYDYAEYIAHIKSVGFHPAVVAYCQQHKDHCLDTSAREKGFVYANPAAWEKVSCYLNACELGGENPFDNAMDITALTLFCGGLLGKDIANAFVIFAKRFMTELLPDHILYEYDKHRDKLKRVIAQGRNDLLAALADTVFSQLWDTKPGLTDGQYLTKDKASGETIHTVAKNIANFVTDLPMDIAQSAVSITQAHDTEGRKYIEGFTIECAKFDAWRSFWSRRDAAINAWKQQ
jgi:hypothetical protein